MSSAPEILVFIDWYLPGYRAGGPIRSLANLVKEVPYHWSIVTSIYDHASHEPYEGIEPNTWIQRSATERVMYIDGKIARRLLRQVIAERPYDHYYINSLFSLNFALRPLAMLKRMRLSHRVILAPRGMLKPGALSIKSRKKQSFLFASRSLGLFNGIHWAATDRAEQDEIYRHFGQDASVHIAPNIPRRLTCRNAPPLKHPGSLRLYTIARVSAEKNIHAGIEFLSKLPEGNIEWSVYGTIQDRAYLTFCLKAAETAPHITVHFKGAIDPEDMPNEVAGFHFMFLPTLGENFGHVIAEALAMGIPVIISNRTPWRDLFGRMAGWDLPLDEGVFCKVLIECLEMDHATYLRFCDGAHNEAMRINDNDDALKANLTLFAATRNEGKN